MKRTRINHMIRISPIRLIGPDNEQIGVVETPDALRMADERGMDLVEISPDARPPVCRIMDYGKFKYEQSKEEKAKTKNKAQELKEVRLGRSIKIDPHDVSIRVEQARRFLLEGHKVQMVQVFRGREMMHRDLGEKMLRDIVESLLDVAKVEVPPRSFGKRVSLILAPDKTKIEAIKRKEAKEAAAKEKDAGGEKPAAEAPAEEKAEA
ncbi:MAG: translation initiation factor IF-3 [Phycisphaerales bacterium]